MAAMIMTEEVYGSTTLSKYSDLAVSIVKTRIIFRCKRKGCKHTWAREYRKIFTVMPEIIWPRSGGKSYRVDAVFSYKRIDEHGVLIDSLSDYDCPECGKHGESNVVVGSLSNHVCDARCMGAKNGACECSCQGMNHGISHL
jgi:hypothetical protein